MTVEARFKELSNLYDELYTRACKVFEGNPCQINKSGCAGSRAKYVTAKNRCCGGCKHLGPKGCTVQALTCKSWVCLHVKLNRDQLHELSEIQRVALDNGLYGERQSKEEIFERLRFRTGVIRGQFQIGA